MGFIPHVYDRGNPDPFEYLEVTASESFAIGEALKFASGKLTKCSGTTTPEYIAMQAVASAPAGTTIPVIRVQPGTVYETELSAAFAAIAKGVKVTIDTAGTGLTATTSSGVAEIVDFDGAAVGDKVRCRFIH